MAERSEPALPIHERILRAAHEIQGNAPPGLVPRHSEIELKSAVTGTTGDELGEWHGSRDREVLLAALQECERRGWMKLLKVFGPWSWELTPSGQAAARTIQSHVIESVSRRSQPVRSTSKSIDAPFHEKVLLEAARIQGDSLDVIPSRPEGLLQSVAEGISGERSPDWHSSRDRELLLAAFTECERRGWMRLLKVMGPWGWTVTAAGLEKAKQLRSLPRTEPPESVTAVLPSGVVTFLLTDIEGSTPLWEADRSSMHEAVLTHGRVITEAVEAAGGQVVKSRGEGDSTFSVFWQPTDAINAALRIQLDFQRRNWPGGLDLKVRSAIHAGQVNPTGDDYLGPVVNRCARLRSLAHGEQVLVSMVVRELVWDGLPQSASLRYLGDYRPEGLVRAEGVFQLCHETLRSDFPPLRTAAQHSSDSAEPSR